MEMIIWFFEGLIGVLKFVLIDFFAWGTSVFLIDWPFESNDASAVFVPIMLMVMGGAFMSGLFLYQVFLRSESNIEKELPKGSGDVILNPDSLIVRMLHRYFGKYPKSSCQLIGQIFGFSFGIIYSLHGCIWFIAGLSALPYHLPTVAHAIIRESDLALQSAISIALSIVNAIALIISILFWGFTNPAILTAILFPIICTIFWKSSLKTRTVSLGALITNKVCFKIEYRR